MSQVGAVIKNVQAVVAESSHPSDVIQYNITLWLSISIGLVLVGAMYHFLTSFDRDDPVLYSQMNMGKGH